MPLYAVEYTYTTETAGVRDEHRPAHRAWLSAQYEAGVVRMSGPYADQSGALIMVEAPDRFAVDSVLADDPFAQADAIAAVRMTEWTQVFGPF